MRTNQGLMYLAIVMDLYSLRVVGWSISTRMTVDLVERALQMAINIRQPKAGLLFHSDRGFQYASGLLNKYKIMACMSSVGACLDNVVVERFFGSLKNEWF